MKVDIELQMRMFCCSKKGTMRKKKKEDLLLAHKSFRKSHNIQSDYKAQVTFRLDCLTSRWRVYLFVKEYSHPLVTPSKWPFLGTPRAAKASH